MLLKAMWVKPDCMIAMCVKKLSICSHHAKDCYMCMCYWLLYIDSLKTAERAYLLPHTCIMGKMIHISICLEPDSTAWLLWEQDSILVTDDIKLWLPPSLLSDEIYAMDWWQQHLKNPPFSRPTSINWTAPSGENLLSKILMCQYIYGSIFLQKKEIVWTFKLAFFFSVVYIKGIHFLRRSQALPCPSVWNPYVWLRHPPPVLLLYIFDEQAMRVQSKLKGTAHLSAICQQLVIWL